MKYKINNRQLCTVFLLAVVVVMYVLNRLTPLFCDDWHYAFVFGTQERIHTIGDVFRSQWAHYQVFNGRYIVHWFVQLFDGILGKGVFNVFNALVFGLFLYVVSLHAASGREHRYQAVSVAFMLVFLFMTGFKYGFLWLSGSLNYLWVGTAVLFFHYLMQKDAIPSWSRVPVFLFSFACGWSHEAFVVGLGAGYFFYFLFHRKRLTAHRLLMLSAFFLGAVLLVFAPASLYRAAHTGSMQLSLVDRIVNLRNLRLCLLLAVIVLVRLFVNRKALARWLVEEQVLLIATLVSIAFILFTGIYNAHSRLAIEIFSLVLVLKNIRWESLDVRVVSVANVAMLLFAGYAIMVCGKCYAVNRQELSRVARGDSLIVTTHPLGESSLMRRYVLDYMGTLLNNGINDDKWYGNEDLVARYYGYKNRFICFMPQQFMDDLKANYGEYEHFRTLKGLPFYAIRLKPGQDLWYVEMVYGPSRYDSLPWPLNRLCVKVSGEASVMRPEVKFVTIDGERYALVIRLKPSQDCRLKEFRLVDYPEWSKPVLTSEPEVIRRHFF